MRHLGWHAFCTGQKADITYSWRASAGTITGNGTSARLDTTGVAPGTSIDVTAMANSAAGNCSASGTAKVMIKVAAPPKPTVVVLTPCTTFKKNNARVDNACKAVLQDVARQLQADPQAQLVVDSYRGEKEKPDTLDLQRGKNVRDRLADGSVGTAIDANRIVVRPGGVSTDGSQVRLTLVPSGADMPEGPAPATLGDVNPEKKAAPGRKGKRRR